MLKRDESVKRISDFLLQARINLGYEEEPKTKRLKDGKRLIGPFKDGDFAYTDTYIMKTLYHFVGVERIFLGRKTIWERRYEGKITDSNHRTKTAAESAYKVLRRAMSKFPKAKPFRRGPSKFRSGNYVYIDSCKGNIGSFTGVETIRHIGKKVYVLNYNGRFSQR